jgi:hypothetical protein
LRFHFGNAADRPGMLDLSTVRGARGDASDAFARSTRVRRRSGSRPSATPLLSRRREHKPTCMKMIHVRLIATANVVLSLIALVTLLSAIAHAR